MTADHLSYQRATSVSLIGLGFQIIFAFATLLYGLFGQDPAALSASFAIMLGIPVWLGLALVFHQHRLERIEAMETEAYAASSAAQASVFGDTGGAENVQANKLAWMHKWFLPILSLAIGAAYVSLGIVRFLANRAALDEGGWTAPEHGGWGISIGVAVAVVGFVFARFVAGMAKQSVWSMLNAGAAAAVGSSLLGAALFIAHFAAEAIGRAGIIKYLPVVIDVGMIALGAEIALNFVLTLYRPRKPGEYLRPAFDSRILAFLAAPDRLAESISEAINYQFGFNVSSTWFYRLVSRSISLLLVLGILISWFMTSFTVVRADQQGVLLRSGRIVREVESGLVFKRPWPFETVLTYPARRVNSITVGTELAPTDDPTAPILWTTATGVAEQYLIVRSSSVGADRGDSSYALLAVEIPILYKVERLLDFLALAQDGARDDRDSMRDDLLESVASRVVTQVMSKYAVDQILGPQRPEIAVELQGAIQQAFEGLGRDGNGDGRPDGAGVRVIFTGIQGVRPPKDVAEAFEAVVAGDHKREAAIQSARAQAILSLGSVAGSIDLANQILDELVRLDRLQSSGANQEQITEQEQRVMDLIVDAGGEAAATIADARKERWVRHMGQRARAQQYQGQVEAYRAAPRAYMTRLYLDALVQTLREARVWITPFESPSIELDQIETNVEIGGLTPSDLEGNNEE